VNLSQFARATPVLKNGENKELTPSNNVVPNFFNN
jgi:hypothetical protein